MSAVVRTSGYAGRGGTAGLLSQRGPSKKTAHAEEDKVFGVPMFFVRDEPFWGNDRIDWVRKRLDELELRKR